MERGEIRNIERYKQLLDFSGMQFERGITPTDFDFVLDFGSKEWIVGEFKTEGNSIPWGQRRCLTSALEVHYQLGIFTLGFIAIHNIPPNRLVPVHDAIVKEAWFDPSVGWIKIRKRRRAREFVDAWRAWIRSRTSAS